MTQDWLRIGLKSELGLVLFASICSCISVPSLSYPHPQMTSFLFNKFCSSDILDTLSEELSFQQIPPINTVLGDCQWECVCSTVLVS